MLVNGLESHLDESFACSTVQRRTYLGHLETLFAPRCESPYEDLVAKEDLTF